jgi:hypothetical protein
MATHYIIEVAADSDEQAGLAEYLLLRLPEAGIFTSVVSIKNPKTGSVDDIERKFPLNVALVNSYAKNREAGE